MPIITKKDYLLIVVIGLLFGLLLIPVLKNIEFSFFEINLKNSLLVVLLFTVIAPVGLFIISLIGRFIPIVVQFAKFASIGGLNTLLDLGVLNLLIFFSGFAAGYWYSLFKAVSFIVANTNSYFWNKYWTFGSSESANVKEFSQFLTVSAVGFGFNVATAVLVVNLIGPVGGISLIVWANIGAISATIISLI